MKWVRSVSRETGSRGAAARLGTERPSFHAGNRPFTGSCARWLAGATLALATGLRATEPTESVPGPIIELPKFEVTDTRVLPPPESWHYAEIPGFEILSNVFQRETKRFVRDFLLLQEVIETIMPGLARGQTPVPTALILCGKGHGLDDFLPADRTVDRFAINSLFFKNQERAAIVVDFAIAELQLENDTRQESDPYRAFYTEYFRFLIRRQLSRPAPAWFEEGLVQLFAATDFDRKTITFAQIGDGFGAEKIGDFNRMLQQRALIPFDQMFGPEGPRGRRRFWAAQCYAFVHFCLYSTNRKYQRPFVQFVQRLDDEPPSEKLFKECFGKTYKQVALELRGYLDFTTYKKMEYRAKKGQELPEPPEIVLRPATDAEVGRIKGEVLRLGGHGALARNAMIAPYVRGERDPRLLAALGLDEKLAGHDDRARKFLEAAAAANVQRARAHLELGRLRLNEVKLRPAGPDGRLSMAQVAGVLTPLFTARKQPPPLAEVYGLIAEAWSLSETPPQAEHLAVVIEGVRMFPRDTALLLQATLLASKRGFPAEAKALAERGVKIAGETADGDRFRMIAAAMERDAKPAPEGEKPPAATPYLLERTTP